jgi:hypothetical protein
VSASGPPYAVAPARFRFPALAALAGRAPLGGPREVALAALMAARLAAGSLDPDPLAPSARARRAAGARRWFAALALPAAARAPFARLVDASAGDSRAALAVALDGTAAAAAPHLDEPAAAELRELVAAPAG